MARKKVVPEYGTIMKRGVQYYRTRMQDADGKWISRSSRSPILAALAFTPPVVSPWAQKCFATLPTPVDCIPVTAAFAIAAARHGSSE